MSGKQNIKNNYYTSRPKTTVEYTFIKSTMVLETMVTEIATYRYNGYISHKVVFYIYYTFSVVSVETLV